MGQPCGVPGEREERWSRLIAEHRANQEEAEGTARGPAVWTELRDRTVLVTVGCVVVFVGWAGVGVWSVIDDWDLPAIYWLPLWIGLPAYLLYELTCDLPEQDFSSQPWGERGREVINLFRWSTMGGREWGFWFIAVGFGIPFSVAGVVVGSPYDRVRSAVLAVICGATGWLGLKCLDARIARRLRKHS